MWPIVTLPQASLCLWQFQEGFVWGAVSAISLQSSITNVERFTPRARWHGFLNTGAPLRCGSFYQTENPHPVATLAVLKRCEHVTSTHGCTRMVYVQCQVGQVPVVELYGWPLVNTHGTVNHRRLFQFSERAICSQLSLISLSRPSLTFSTPDLLLRVRQGQLCSASPCFSQTRLNLGPLLPTLHLSQWLTALESHVDHRPP